MAEAEQEQTIAAAHYGGRIGRRVVRPNPHRGVQQCRCERVLQGLVQALVQRVRLAELLPRLFAKVHHLVVAIVRHTVRFGIFVQSRQLMSHPLQLPLQHTVCRFQPLAGDMRREGVGSALQQLVRGDHVAFVGNKCSGLLLAVRHIVRPEGGYAHTVVRHTEVERIFRPEREGISAFGCHAAHCRQLRGGTAGNELPEEQ